MKKLLIAFFILFSSSVLLAFLFAEQTDLFNELGYHATFSAMLAFVIYILDHNRREIENTTYCDTILLNHGEELKGIKSHIIKTTDWQLEEEHTDTLVFRTDIDVALSMGEEIRLCIVEEHKLKYLKITSRSLLPTRLFDYGINGKNVKAMYLLVKGAFISSKV